MQRLAANAAHTVLFPRPRLHEDMRRLVGIDLGAHAERHTIVPEGVDLVTIDRALAEAAAHADGGEPGPALAELRTLVEGLAPERRGLPLVVSVGRLHRVKGMATLVEAWADGPLAERANLLVIGTHGYGPIKRFLLGSVATRVLRAAPCPVVTVPPMSWPRDSHQPAVA